MPNGRSGQDKDTEMAPPVSLSRTYKLFLDNAMMHRIDPSVPATLSSNSDKSSYPIWRAWI